MYFRPLTVAAALGLTAAPAFACDYTTDREIRHISAAFEAWQAIAGAMRECAPNMVIELDQEFRTKQPTAFAAQPSLYHIGGVANGTLTPLLNEGTIRPLDELVEKYGEYLNENQFIRVGGRIMAISFMVNAQHFMYREDIFEELGLATPETYDDVLEAAAAIREAGSVPYPIGATMQTGWNLALEFINLFYGFGGEPFVDGSTPNINTEAGVKALEMMKALTEYMDPEYLVADPTYVQQQFQQARIAMANQWGTRAAAMDDEDESEVAGLVAMAAAPAAAEGGPPATTIWWDGFVIARNISDEEAEAAFRIALEGISPRMVEANDDVAVWLIDGYEPSRLAEGVIESAMGGAAAYPSSVEMGLLHTAIGNNIADFLLGLETAEESLADAEAAYLVAAREAGLIQ